MEELYMKLTSPLSEGLTDEEYEEYKQLVTESTLVERKVLKVGSSQPQMPVDPNMGMADPNMGGEMPMGDDMMGDPSMESDGGSEFDTNFDAGVEADEDEDPKKYIQQLTGKLSQELGKYNNELGEPDVELSKYVGGMIVKQVAKGLGEDDKKELIKKINTSEDPETEDDDLEVDTEENPEMEPQMESYTLTKEDLGKLFENFNTTIEDERDKNLDLDNESKRKKRNEPFISKFKTGSKK